MLYQDAFLKRLEAGVRSALPDWGLPPSAPVSLLTISENATYLAEDAANGRLLVFRVYRPDYHTPEEIVSELAWIAALRDSGSVQTPRPVPATDGSVLRAFDDGGSTRQIVCFEHMSGSEPAPSGDVANWYRRLGEVTARLHAHSRSWRTPAGFMRKTWDFETIIGDRPHWGDWRAGLGLDAQGEAVLARTAALLRAQTEAYGRDPQKFGLIHADMRPANLLVDGERLGVIDFDDCGLSWFAYDFAASVSFLEAEPFIPDLTTAWIDGYRSVAPFSAADEAALPMFVMLRRMQLTAWIASHSETPTAQAMGVAYTKGSVELAEAYLARNG